MNMNPEAENYRKKMLNPFIFWVAMLSKLPSAIFWRLRVKKLDQDKCEVSLPFFWRTQNPFRSIYFAALAGAAELSTGILCQMALAGKGKFSMLVVDFRAEFYKKATTTTLFICEQGHELNDCINKLGVNESDKITLVSTGTSTSGEIVAKFFITWSFKKKG